MASSSSGGDRVQVLVRLRPDGPDTFLSPTSTTLTPPNGHPLHFHTILPQTATQAEVFDQVGVPLVNSLMEGYNAAVFVYGQTGAGKTYTMHGDARGGPQGRGLTPRVLEYLFASIEAERALEREELAEERGRARDELQLQEGEGEGQVVAEDGEYVPTRYTVQCSYMEVYNENVFDLLHDPDERSSLATTATATAASATATGAPPNMFSVRYNPLAAQRGEKDKEKEFTTRMAPEESPLVLRKAGGLTVRDTVENQRGMPSLRLREDGKRGVLVEGLKVVVAAAPEEVAEVLRRGERNRAVGMTVMNRQSSRSHSIFTITLTVTTRNNNVDERRSSRVHLVDLAGSERNLQVADKVQLSESSNINRSLAALGNVINALAKGPGKKTFVPYRSSKLTFLLRDALGGNSRTTVIANISSSEVNAGETMSTLKFASRAREIRTDAHAAVAAVTREELMEQVKLLTADLAKERARVRAFLEIRCEGCGQPFVKDVVTLDSPREPKKVDKGEKVDKAESSKAGAAKNRTIPVEPPSKQAQQQQQQQEVQPADIKTPKRRGGGRD
jgi:hypothetical protein